MNILLLTPVAPNPKSSGGLMLYQMINATKKHHSFFCFSVNDFFKPIWPAKDLKIPYKNVYRPFDRMIFSKHESLSNGVERLKEAYVKSIIIPAAVRFGTKHNVECVWAVLQDKVTITSARTIAEKLAVPLKTQIWDSPRWMIAANHIDSKSGENILRHFDDTIIASQSCAVASWKMAEYYSKRYGVKTVVLVSSVKKTEMVKTSVLNNKKVIIGFAGQLYAQREWRALISTLESIDWKINNKNIEICLIGDFKKRHTDSNTHIKLLGRFNQSKTIRLLSKMDIGYCPYWFDKRYKEIAQTSFPSKLTTYYAAGIPILFHGPLYSSPASFIAKNNSGVLCSSLREKDIVKSIQQAISDRPKIVERQRQATIKHLTNHVFNKNSLRFLSRKNFRKNKILIVGFADSIHTKRWIEHINNKNYSIVLFPSIVTIFTDMTHTVRVSSLIKKKHNRTVLNRLINYSLYRLSPFINKRYLKKVIRREKPDIIHSLEFQHAGYLVNSVRKSWKGKFPVWIATNWGSDIYYFGKQKKHVRKIKEVLKNCDYYSCECKRDTCLAENYGLQRNKILPVFPNTGGFDLNKLKPIRNRIKTSNRKIIMLKGYQNWAGRAHTALKALERCVHYLKAYTLVIYSVQPRSNIIKEIRGFAKRTGVKVRILPLNTSHQEMLRMHSRARISIGISVSDGISTSLLESIIMGSFPVQSDTACADEWITHNKSGAIVPYDDVKIIAESIEKALVDDRLVDRAAKINWQTAKNRLSKEIIKEKINLFYKKALHNG